MAIDTQQKRREALACLRPGTLLPVATGGLDILDRGMMVVTYAYVGAPPPPPPDSSAYFPRTFIRRYRHLRASQAFRRTT